MNRRLFLFAGLLAALALAARGGEGAAPVDPRNFKHRREIPAGPPGLTSLLLDAAVLSRSPGLDDLRIADSQGRQVPYILELRDEPLPLSLPALKRRAGEGDPPSLSRYRIELPYPSLPRVRRGVTILPLGPPNSGQSTSLHQHTQN